MLHPICEGKLWGFIDRTGAVVVEPTFTEVRLGMREAPYAVRVGKRWGFIDEVGTLVVEPKLSWAFPYSEGLAVMPRVKKGQQLFGYVDLTGAWVIEPQFTNAGGFREGFAPIRDPNGEDWLIDTTGARRFRVHGCAGFSEGLAITSPPDNPTIRGYIDTTGAWAIEPRSWLLFQFHEGLAEVRIAPPPSSEWQPARVGYIDKTGAWVIEPTQLVDVGGGGGPFCEGLAQAKITHGGPTGYIDKTGAWVIEPQFGWTGKFSEGLAMAGPNSMAQGFIDRTGAFVVAPRFYLAQDFRDGIAMINPDAKRKAAVGYIDKIGRWIWQPAKPFAAKFHP